MKYVIYLLAELQKCLLESETRWHSKNSVPRSTISYIHMMAADCNSTSSITDDSRYGLNSFNTVVLTCSVA